MNAPAYNRIVVKLGTSSMTGGTDHLDPRRLLAIVEQVAALHEVGREVILVSSGAMAAGREVLNNPDLGRNIPARQMLAAVGQPRLMHVYADLFAIFGLHVAQVLLTSSDFRNRQRYLNARDTLTALVDQRLIAIVNENDTTATDEIKVGENDTLSALVANLVDADLLVLLTDQPGLFTADPRTDPDAALIHHIEEIDDSLWQIAGESGTPLGTGGMRTKVQAAQLAIRSGTAVVIAQGTQPGILLDLVGPEGRQTGTWFTTTVSQVESRKRWILSEPSQGVLRIDQGAAEVLRRGAASLLPVGVTAVEGEFDRGVIVGVTGPHGGEIARGLVKYDSTEIRQIRGIKSHQIAAHLGYTYGNEVIHRDDLVIV